MKKLTMLLVLLSLVGFAQARPKVPYMDPGGGASSSGVISTQAFYGVDWSTDLMHTDMDTVTASSYYDETHYWDNLMIESEACPSLLTGWRSGWNQGTGLHHEPLVTIPPWPQGQYPYVDITFNSYHRLGAVRFRLPGGELLADAWVSWPDEVRLYTSTDFTMGQWEYCGHWAWNIRTYTTSCVYIELIPPPGYNRYFNHLRVHFFNPLADRTRVQDIQVFAASDP